MNEFLIFFFKNLIFIIISVRKVWKEYFPAVDAIVFLIDVWDRQRFIESKAELDSLLADEQVINCPVLILGNKIDKIGAVGEMEVRQYFNLNGLTTGKVNRKRIKKIIFFHNLIFDYLLTRAPLIEMN